MGTCCVPWVIILKIKPARSWFGPRIVTRRTCPVLCAPQTTVSRPSRLFIRPIFAAGTHTPESFVVHRRLLLFLSVVAPTLRRSGNVAPSNRVLLAGVPMLTVVPPGGTPHVHPRVPFTALPFASLSLCTGLLLSYAAACCCMFRTQISCTSTTISGAWPTCGLP